MKVGYYSFEISGGNETMEQVMTRIGGMDLALRESGATDAPILAEYVSIGPKFIKADFTLRRMTGGPGLSRRGEETEDFAIESGAGFGEQTATIWSPKGYVAIQYNHRGPKSGSIRQYVENFLDSEDVVLELTPYVDPKIWNRFQSSEEQFSLECTIDARTLTREMAKGNIPFEQAVRARQEMNVGKLKMRFYYGNDRLAGPGNFRSVVRDLFENLQHVETLKVGVRENVDGASEILNLLGHQEVSEVSNDNLEKTPGKRYSRDSRLKAIQAHFEKWLQEL